MIVMRSKYCIFNILILSMLLLSLIPVVNLYDLFYLLVYLPIIFIFTIIIEFVVIYLSLRNYGIEQSQLTKPVIVVNFLSFPITQIIIYFVMEQDFPIHGFVLLLELFPIALECFLYLKIFKYYNQLKYFEFPVSVKKTFKTLITANLITFIIGLWLYPPKLYLF